MIDFWQQKLNKQRQLSTRMYNTSSTGDLDQLNKLLQLDDFDINKKFLNPNQDNPHARKKRDMLYFAAFGGHPDMVKRLLELGATNLDNALHATISSRADSAIIIQIINLLLEAGVNLNYTDRDNLFTALISAVRSQNLDIVKFLLEHGADVNEHDQSVYHWTPLLFAIRNNNLNLIRYLLQSGANPLYIDKCEISTLKHAQRTGRADIVNILTDAIKAMEIDLQRKRKILLKKMQQQKQQPKPIQSRGGGDRPLTQQQQQPKQQSKGGGDRPLTQQEKRRNKEIVDFAVVNQLNYDTWHTLSQLLGYTPSSSVFTETLAHRLLRMRSLREDLMATVASIKIYCYAVKNLSEVWSPSDEELTEMRKWIRGFSQDVSPIKNEQCFLSFLYNWIYLDSDSRMIEARKQVYEKLWKKYRAIFMPGILSRVQAQKQIRERSPGECIIRLSSSVPGAIVISSRSKTNKGEQTPEYEHDLYFIKSSTQLIANDIDDNIFYLQQLFS
jgi:hypothetical protein